MSGWWRLWRAPVCGSLWLDDNPDEPGRPECGCDRCGGSEMTSVGWVAAEDVVALARPERGGER